MPRHLLSFSFFISLLVHLLVFNFKYKNEKKADQLKFFVQSITQEKTFSNKKKIQKKPISTSPRKKEVKKNKSQPIYRLKSKPVLIGDSPTPIVPKEYKYKTQKIEMKVRIYLNSKGLIDKIFFYHQGKHPLLEQSIRNSLKNKKFTPAKNSQNVAVSHDFLTTFKFEID